MIRVTLDANVLAPGFTSQGGASNQIIERWRARDFELVVSSHLVEELERALTDRYFAARLGHDRALAIVAELNAVATFVYPTADIRGVASHPEDDVVLSTALNGQAVVLCTRDKQLLRLQFFRDIAILSPGEFQSMLESSESK